MDKKVYSLLQEHRLDEYSKNFLDLGVKDAKDFIDGVTDENLTRMGLSIVERNRFRRMQEHIENPGNPSAGNPNPGSPIPGNPNAGNPNLGNPNPGIPRPESKCPEPKELATSDFNRHFSAMHLTSETSAVIISKMDEKVYSLLQEHRLHEYSKNFLDLGVKDAKYFIDGITAEHLMSMGLSSVERNRFKRMQEHIKELGPVCESAMHQIPHKICPEPRYPEPKYPEPKYPEPKYPEPKNLEPKYPEPKCPEPKESRPQVVVREDTRHKFILSTFGATTFCSVCRDHIWGLTKQGYKCTMCNAAFHKKCVDKITDKCTEANRGTVIDKPHLFKTHNYKVPTYCAHCGNILVGIYQQGCRCEYCTMDVHAVCQKKVAKPCINY